MEMIPNDINKDTPVTLCKVFKVTLSGGRVYLKHNRTFSTNPLLLDMYLTAEQAQLLIDILNEETDTLPVAYGRDFLI
mgnify:CR=1 FL=1